MSPFAKITTLLAWGTLANTTCGDAFKFANLHSHRFAKGIGTRVAGRIG
jgi:hypothetical protein